MLSSLAKLSIIAKENEKCQIMNPLVAEAAGA